MCRHSFGLGLLPPCAMHMMPKSHLSFYLTFIVHILWSSKYLLFFSLLIDLNFAHIIWKISYKLGYCFILFVTHLVQKPILFPFTQLDFILFWIWSHSPKSGRYASRMSEGIFVFSSTYLVNAINGFMKNDWKQPLTQHVIWFDV